MVVRVPARQRGSIAEAAACGAVAEAGAAGNEDSAVADGEEDSIAAMENQLKRKSVRAAREAKRTSPERPFQVDAPARDAALSDTLTDAQIFEGRAVTVLILVFSACLVEGLVVGASGFLPDSADQFVRDFVYPAFSPTIGLFLACSTAYGLWKSRQGG